MEPTSPRPARRTTYRIFCADCDEAHNLDNAGFATDRRNVLNSMSAVRAVAFDHVRFAANTCSQMSIVVEVTTANGHSTERPYGIFDGRLVRLY